MSKGSDAEKKDDDEQEPDDDQDAPITDNPKEKAANESLVSEDYSEKNPNKNPVSTADLAAAALTQPENKKFKEISDKAKQARGDAKDAIKNNADIVKKAMEVNMKFACQYLQDYMTAFAGEDAAVGIKPEDVRVSYVPEKFADPYKNKKYDRYQIPAMSEAEVRQEKIRLIQDMRAGKARPEDVFKNMCFKVAYSLDIGK